MKSWTEKPRRVVNGGMSNSCSSVVQSSSNDNSSFFSTAHSCFNILISRINNRRVFFSSNFMATYLSRQASTAS